MSLFNKLPQTVKTWHREMLTGAGTFVKVGTNLKNEKKVEILIQMKTLSIFILNWHLQTI